MVGAKGFFILLALARTVMISVNKIAPVPMARFPIGTGSGWSLRRIHRSEDGVTFRRFRAAAPSETKTLTQDYLQTLQSLRAAAAKGPEQFGYGVICTPKTGSDVADTP